jgi:energy-coupling factor transport system substrate-specific component
VSWQVASFGILGLGLAGGFAWYERSRPPAKVLSLVAALAALAVVGRLAFAAIPNVKPTTDIVLFAGFALGAAPGFAVGAVTALVSNVFLSQGPWTAWQMAAWGGVGIAGALLGRAWRGREPGRLPLAAACGAAGLAFGAFMDVYQWTLASRQDLASYVAVSGSSLPYNLAHAGGNVAFCLLLGPVFLRALRRYRRRFEVRWEAPRPALLAAAVAALAVCASLSAAPAAEAASASARAARYLERSQNRDGGFGAARGQSSSQLYTGWTALGLAAARRNPRDVHRPRGHAITTYLRRGARGLRDLGELERTILVLRAAGVSPRSFAGRDLVAELRHRRRASGSFAGYVSYTAFGMLALKAVRSSPGASSAAWLARAQNGDGGFGVAPHVASDSDMTGAVLQALAAAGRAHGERARQAVGFLLAAQNGDGGFGAAGGRSSNAQSTAYAVQGLVAAHAARGRVRRALRYLKGLQRRDGSIRYSHSSAQTPVWVTAQALAALRRRPLPLGTVPRKRRARPAAAAAPPAAPAPRASSPSGKRSSSSRAAKARANRSHARTGPASPPRPPRLELDEASAGRAHRRAPAGDADADGDGGVPAPILVGAGVPTLLLLAAGGRRWLRRRRVRAA